MKRFHYRNLPAFSLAEKGLSGYISPVELVLYLTFITYNNNRWNTACAACP